MSRRASSPLPARIVASRSWIRFRQLSSTISRSFVTVRQFRAVAETFGRRPNGLEPGDIRLRRIACQEVQMDALGRFVRFRIRIRVHRAPQVGGGQEQNARPVTVPLLDAGGDPRTAGRRRRLTGTRSDL